jgi:predicted nuclease of predicted toxin-antitoxin system
MKLLFDQNLSFKLCEGIADIFPGSSQVRLLGLAEADDRAIWEFAKTNEFALVSQDADFAEMAALLGPPPKVIWLRAGNRPTRAIATLLRLHSTFISDFDQDETAACLEIDQGMFSSD